MSLGSGKCVFSQSKTSYCVPLNQHFDELSTQYKAEKLKQ